MTDRGTYLEYDGRPAVRFVRTYPYPVERVWRAVTEPAELQAWFPSSVRLEPRAGGTIEFTGDPYSTDSTGTILVYEPPHRLAYTWDNDELHFELTATGEGCTLTLIDVLDERPAAARNAAGWHECLEALDGHFRGRSGGPHGSMEDYLKVYETYVADGLPSGAEIPDPA